MGWRGTVILGALAAIAAVAFLLSPRPQEPLSDSTLLGEPRYKREDATAPKLLDFVADDIVTMNLGYRDEVVTVSRAGNGKWRGAADDRNLGDFLDSIAEATILASIEENQGELRDFGLDAPTRRLLLEDAKGRAVSLFMGERNPAGTAVYVRVNDGPVQIAGALLVWEFDKAFAAITGRKPVL